MATFAFSGKVNKPSKEGLAVALGRELGELCSALFMHTAKAFGGMQNIKADWLYDNINDAWNLIVNNGQFDVYTVYGMADGFVCHFFYKDSHDAHKRGHEAWVKISDKHGLEEANSAITFIMG